MIGPTGVGKTEIARRLAKLAGAPFIKVEATKFTEVGYVGRDVESIVRDLVDAAVKMLRQRADRKGHERAPQTPRRNGFSTCCCPSRERRFRRRRRIGPTRRRDRCSANGCAKASSTTARSRSNFPAAPIGVEIMAPPGMEEMTNQLQSMFSNLTSGSANAPCASR